MMRYVLVVALLLLALAPFGPALAWGDEEDTTIYAVVVNAEEQYSIWPNDRERPLGWRDAGFTGLKADCLAYIERVWTDMRPLSLRTRMQQMCLEQGGTLETCQ